MLQPLELVSDLAKCLEEAEEACRVVPLPTPPGDFRELTIGMASYDDFDGVYFTIQSVRLYHPEVADRVAFVVVDNHPEGPHAVALKALENRIPHYRYVPFRGYRGTAVRDLIFREASSEIVLCVDSHVLFAPGALSALLDYFAARPGTCDLIQGPTLHDALDNRLATHQEPVWRDGMFGVWASDARGLDANGPAFEIDMQGLGVFACRQKVWPGLNPRFRGHGSEEGYLHEKIRRAGGRVLCLPALRWLHRFDRPSGPPYPIRWNDRVRNHLLGWQELGWNEYEVLDHFRSQIGDRWTVGAAEEITSRAQQEATSPFVFFDAVFCLNLDDRPDRWQAARDRFAQLGIDWLVERFPAVPTPHNHHYGCALSFRAMVAEARRRNLDCFLVVEDDAIWLDTAEQVLAQGLDELKGRSWDLLYLGGGVREESLPVAGCTTLRTPPRLTCTHAVAVNRTAYERILEEVPPEGAEFDDWLTEYIAIDEYLPRRVADGTYQTFVLEPRIASQPELIAIANRYLDAAIADRYTIR